MICDMVTELVAAPGTGAITTGTPVAGRFSFAQAITAGVFALTQPIYIIINNGTQWEVVKSTVSAGSLSRDTVLLNSSNTQPSKINFTTTACYVYPYIPAQRSVYRNAAGDLVAPYSISALNIPAAPTWHDVTGSRVLTTTYTNPQTYPISVMVTTGTGGGGGGSLLQVTVAGVVISAGQSAAVAGNYNTTFQVPAGATYAVGGGGTMSKWFEFY